MFKIVLFFILLAANIPVYKFYFRTFFNDVDDFKESVRYSLTPDLFSLFKGRFWKDQFGEAKLTFFIFISIITVVLEFGVISFLLGLIGVNL